MVSLQDSPLKAEGKIFKEPVLWAFWALAESLRFSFPLAELAMTLEFPFVFHRNCPFAFGQCLADSCPGGPRPTENSAAGRQGPSGRD